MFLPHENKLRISAFTLVELLTVLLIIAVLSALLFPVIQRMRENSRTVKAIENAKVLTRGGLHYAAEHNGSLPTTDFSSYPDASKYTRWVPELAPYVYGKQHTNSSGQILVEGSFRAPGLNGYKQYKDKWHPWGWGNVDWINVNVAYHPGTTTRVPLSTMIHANSNTPFIVSTDKNAGTAGLAQGLQSSFNLYVPPEVWIYNDGVIVGYLDGHVEIIQEPNSQNIFNQ